MSLRSFYTAENNNSSQYSYVADPISGDLQLGPPTSVSASQTGSVESLQSYHTARRSNASRYPISRPYNESYVRHQELNADGGPAVQDPLFSPSPPEPRTFQPSAMLELDDLSEDEEEMENIIEDVQALSADEVQAHSAGVVVSTSVDEHRLTRVEENVAAILRAIQSLVVAPNIPAANFSSISNSGAPPPPPPPPPPGNGSVGHHVGPARRSSLRTALARKVRAELIDLLGKDLANQNSALSRDELNMFASTWGSPNWDPHPPCCTISDFQVDLTGSPRSPWNQSASRVFTAHFATKFALGNHYLPIIQNLFYQRMKSLQAAFRKRNDDNAAKKALSTAKRRWQRKQTLFQKRLSLSQQHPLLQAHVPILERLGVNAMSSDESDYDDDDRYSHNGAVILGGPGAPKYTIHAPVWHAEALSFWLQTIDSLFIFARRESGRHRGSFPRLRISSDTMSSSTSFVTDLPVNAYSQSWLAGRAYFQFDVRPTNEVYSFTHDNRIFSYFNQYGRSRF